MDSESQIVTIYVEDDETDLPKFDSNVTVILRWGMRIFLLLVILMFAFKFVLIIFGDREIAEGCGDPPGMHEPEKQWVVKFSGGDPSNTHRHPSYFQMLIDGRADQIIDEMTLEPVPHEYSEVEQVTFN